MVYLGSRCTRVAWYVSASGVLQLPHSDLEIFDVLVFLRQILFCLLLAVINSRDLPEILIQVGSESSDLFLSGFVAIDQIVS